MDTKRSFGQKLEAFFMGKGFYIVLALCVVATGFAAYMLLRNNESDVEETSALYDYEYEYNYDEDMAQEPAVQEEIPDLEAIEEEARQQANSMEDTTAEPPTEAEPEEEAEETGEWTEGNSGIAVNAEFVWPVMGEISLPYSVAALVFNETMGDWRTHDGIDIEAQLGTQVVAAGTGKVLSVSTDPVKGTTVVIEHAGGLKSSYSNLAEVPTVYEGDSIMTGEVIGAVGNTAVGETEDNPHLQFSMTLDGQSVNPVDHLPEK